MILATDMADHMANLNVIDSKVKHKNIDKELNNGNLIIDNTDSKVKFQSQQQCLDFMIHAADLSQPTRRFETLRSWVYLLFEEFFQ